MAKNAGGRYEMKKGKRVLVEQTKPAASNDKPMNEGVTDEDKKARNSSED